MYKYIYTYAEKVFCVCCCLVVALAVESPCFVVVLIHIYTSRHSCNHLLGPLNGSPGAIKWLKLGGDPRGIRWGSGGIRGDPRLQLAMSKSTRPQTTVGKRIKRHRCTPPKSVTKSAFYNTKGETARKIAAQNATRETPILEFYTR